jgi:hypothetical protein
MQREREREREVEREREREYFESLFTSPVSPLRPVQQQAGGQENNSSSPPLSPPHSPSHSSASRTFSSPHFWEKVLTWHSKMLTWHKKVLTWQMLTWQVIGPVSSPVLFVWESFLLWESREFGRWESMR